MEIIKVVKTADIVAHTDYNLEAIIDEYENRDIRFRAWDKLGKRMLFSKVFKEPGNTVESFLAFNYPYGENRSYMGWSELDLIKMYSTYATDLNNKEIYEGDIVTAQGPYDEIQYFVIRKHTFCEGNIAASNCTIVGNIFENADLLNDFMENGYVRAK